MIIKNRTAFTVGLVSFLFFYLSPIKAQEHSLLHEGATKIGEDKKIGVTIYYRVYDTNISSYKDNFVPDSQSPPFVPQAKYLYTYQPKLENDFPGVLNFLAIKLKDSNELVTSWGHLNDIDLKTIPIRPVNYDPIAPPIEVKPRSIRFIADSNSYIKPNLIEFESNYLSVVYTTPVSATKFSRTIAFTSDYPPIFTSVYINDEMSGTVPVPHREEEAIVPAITGNYLGGMGGVDSSGNTTPFPSIAPPGASSLNGGSSGGGGLGGGLGNGNDSSTNPNTVIKENTTTNTNTLIKDNCCNSSHIVPEPPTWIFGAFSLVYLFLVGKFWLKARIPRS